MKNSQKRAVESYRARLSERGLTRFEVLGLSSDRELIRSLARRLAQQGAETGSVRSALMQAIGGKEQTGGILAALRRSPLVGEDLDLERPRLEGRDIKL
jgi:hypothetical protein